MRGRLASIPGPRTCGVRQALPLTRGRPGNPALADGGEILRKMAHAGIAKGSQVKIPESSEKNGASRSVSVRPLASSQAS
jgi:hypothetical protein